MIKRKTSREGRPKVRNRIRFGSTRYTSRAHPQKYARLRIITDTATRFDNPLSLRAVKHSRAGKEENSRRLRAKLRGILNDIRMDDRDSVIRVPFVNVEIIAADDRGEGGTLNRRVKAPTRIAPH